MSSRMALFCILGNTFFAYDFLDDQRHSNDDSGLDVGEGLCDDGWRGQAVEEEQVASEAEGEDELNGHAVHVGHGQDAQHVAVLLQVYAQVVQAEVQVAPQGAVGQHDTFGESGGAAGVVDECQFFRLVLVPLYVFLTECLGILVAEHLI